MDKAIKEGQLYVQQNHKFGKKWKKNWFVLYPASQYGIARLEFYDCKESNNMAEKPNTKKLDKKIIRLAECISIVPDLTEACPKDNMLAFCIETNEKCFTFATEKQAAGEWVDRLCEIAFPSNSTDLKKLNITENSSSSTKDKPVSLEMSENSIYYSREEVSEFRVTVQKTEAAERCELYGTYILKADSENLILKDARSKEVLYTWPYKLLRRYGRDKVMFSFEAGRRCESGPGNFTFETKQGNEIFQIVEASIKQQKAQAEENRKSYPSLDSDSAFPLLKNASVESTLAGRVPPPPVIEPSLDSMGSEGDCGGCSKLGLANKYSIDEQYSTRSTASYRPSEDKDGAKLLKARSLPEPPITLSKTPIANTPPRSPLPKVPKGSHGEDQTNLYSEPLDSVKAQKPKADSLYSDPVDTVPASKPLNLLRLKHCSEEEKPPAPLYSDLYERVTYDLAVTTGSTKTGGEEHIYDEPEGRAPHPLPPLSSIYDEARPSGNAWRKQAQADQVGHEVPYNPKTDDYSVPPFQKHKEPPSLPKGKGPKPLTAPKPQVLPRHIDNKDNYTRANVNSSNNNNSALYSKVMKLPKGAPPSCTEKENPPEQAANSKLEPTYEDLGNI
ncbi:docking protein 1b [Latimeria chalumnae]|uniref:docking protein 1b n=1 Tax=Latimeria chalumnae TaxID=7897 RepID=UPI00313A8210